MFELLKAKLAGARKSWTAWFNGILVVLIPMLPTIKDALQENLPQLQPYLTPKVYLAGVVLIAAINFGLRFRTGQPLQDK